MRTSIGIGLFALVSALACSAADGTGIVSSDPGSAGGDGTVTDTDATDPSAPGGDEKDDADEPAHVASGVSITGIAVFQGVKVDVLEDGRWVDERNAPVVANRPALVRVYVEPDRRGSRELTAELRLVDGSKKLPIVRDTKTIDSASSDGDPSSVFDLEVPATSLPPGVTFQIAITSEDGEVPEGDSDGRFPRDGSMQALDARTSGKVKVVVVPVEYDTDGSGRTPDVSSAQLAQYKKTMMSRYPASEIDVSVRAPFKWRSTIAGNGTGFSQILNAITNLREQDGVPDDVYYYGALAPASSFNSFCYRGCVTGLSTVVDRPNMSYLRASVGIGYSGMDSANTMAHEVGHAHGRNHAPCGGAQGVDPSFPYSGGGIGVLGYDILDKSFISPQKGHDMMGYCSNEWVSDYTFAALFDRIASVNGSGSSSAVAAGAASDGGAYRAATVDADGEVTWSNTHLVLARAPEGGELRDATFFAGDASLGTRTAHFYPYDHLPGGVLIVPDGPTGAPVMKVPTLSPATWSRVQIGGETLAR